MEASTPEDQQGNLSAFADLVDPRDSARCCYPLQELLLVALAGVASGAEDWVGVAYWGRMKLEWLRRWLPFERGIASHDTFNRVFALLDAEQFEACFVRWMHPPCPTLEGAALAIDGKSVRDSRSSEQAMVHMVSLCETASGLTLAQCRTKAKSNEITAVPLLLDMLDVRGATISIDAIGCQREIADKIVECGADFILSANNNQPNLAQAGQTPFDHSVRDVALGQLQAHITTDQGHARRDTRRCVVTHDLSAMGEAVRELWPAIRLAIMIESTCEFLSGKNKGQASIEQRDYINSATLEAEEFNRRIRAH